MGGTRAARVAFLIVAITVAGAGSGTPAHAGGIRTRLGFYARKVRDAPRPDVSLVLASALRLAVHATGGRRVDRVPLHTLTPVHGRVTTTGAAKDARRSIALRAALAEAGGAPETLTLAFQARALPSKNPLLVLPRARGGLVVLDGNSRLRALEDVFGKGSPQEVEVVRFESRSRVVQALLERLIARRARSSPPSVR